MCVIGRFRVVKAAIIPKANTGHFVACCNDNSGRSRIRTSAQGWFNAPATWPQASGMGTPHNLVIKKK